MKATTSNIFMLSASDFAPGVCAICNNPVLIRFRDTSTGCRIGSCCIAFAIEADKTISSKRNGIRHLTEQEAAEIPNN